MNETSEKALRAEPRDTHQLVVRLGQGGTAQVYLAMQHGAHGVDKLVVLKLLQPTLAESEEARQMLLDEARILARLNHANIVQTSGVVVGALGPAMVMEYLEGQSLASLRARGAIPLTMHLRIIVEALRGLHHAHEICDHEGRSLGLVHRDVSPQNIFVTYDGQVKLIDFGIAKRAAVDPGTTGIGVIKGKIRYMPPEQFGGPDIDRRVDVYAAGVILWEAAGGQRMWKGLEDVTIMHHVLNGDIPAVRTANPDVPEELERIVMKAITLDRARRYATAAELEADLEAFLATSSPVVNRDIGRFVSETFADTRAETKRVIDQQLRAGASRVPFEEAGQREEPPLLRTSTAAQSHSGVNNDITRSAPLLPRRGSRLWGAALLVLALGMVILFVPQLRGSSSGPGSVASTLPSQEIGSGSPSAAPDPAPPSAPASTGSDTVAPESPGAPTGAAASASAPVRGAPGRLSPHAPAMATPSSKPAAPKRNCNPPFTVDASGTKHFKVECL